ncbi:MAG: TlpA family protein disulfide reductase [Verrucomicrobiales bacterium]|nr:TlpA family protein disulfide reductase [Verrucomicrobiales bacterium]
MRNRSRSLTLILLAVLLAPSCLGSAAQTAVAPDFSLPRRGTNAVLRLADLAGQIVVLDFFAYWCAPCARASSELEQQVAAYYAARGGNPAKAPVRVVAINVESTHPAKTDAFVRKHQLGFVVDDDRGKTLAAYGGRGLPFLVIIDGTAATREDPVFRIVYRHAGYEGATKLRRIIDGLPQGRVSGTTREGPKPPAGHPDGLSLLTADGRGMRATILLASHPAPGLADGPDPVQAMIVAALGNGAPQAPPAQPAAVEPDGEAGRLAGGGPPMAHRAEGDFESVFASDILLTQVGLGYVQTIAGTEWGVALAWASLGFDYEPVSFDFLGSPAVVEEGRLAGQLSLRQRVSERFAFLGAAGLYDGFTDYRSAWIDEYFRQQYGTLPGYEEAAPRGANVQAGVRWEYVPASAFLQLDAGFLQDQIAPGYEIDFDGLRRGRPVLYTTVWSLLAENILTPRLRSQGAIRLVDTTEREPRYAAQGWLNWAAAEGLVLRTTGGYTTEDPTFEAWFFGLTLERELASSLWLSLSGRYYTDTGEIENSLFSTAAPGLSAWQVGVGAHYAWAGSTLRLYVAPYFTDHDRSTSAPRSSPTCTGIARGASCRWPTA